MAGKRTAKEVIDQLVAENRGWQYLCFVAAIGFFVVGLVVICRALFWEQPVILTVIGGVCGYLFIPALDRAMRIMKENQAIRLMEIPLSHAKTTEEAARLLQDVFRGIYLDKKG